MHIYSFKANPRDSCAFFAFFLFLGVLSSLGVDPGFDHAHFEAKVRSYASMHAAIRDTSPNLAPLTSLYSIVWHVFGFSKFYLIFNAATLAVSLSLLSQMLKVKKPKKVLLTVFAFPVVALLLVTISKDIVVALSVFVFVASLSRLIGRINRSLRFSGVLFDILGLISSVVIIAQLRSYFLGYLAISFVLVFLLALLRGFLFTFRRSLVTVISFQWIFLAITILLFWEKIRILVYTYFGNAEIPLLSSMPIPSLVTFSSYPFISVLGYFIALLWVPIFEVSSPLKAAVGLWEASWFLIAIASSVFYMLQKEGISFISGFIFFFSCTHLVVQVLGSPNIGSLHRLFLVEKLVLIAVLANVKLIVGEFKDG